MLAKFKGQTMRSQVKALQELMKRANLNAFVIPTADIHASEYVPKCFADRAFVSGFTGSAGTLVVLENTAHLFTDGRYHLQAQKELARSGITLQKQSPQHTYPKFLCQVLKNGDFIGINPKNLSISAHKELKHALKKANLKLKFADLVSEIFTRPPLPKSQIFAHTSTFTAKSAKSKLKIVREKMQEQNATHHFISSLDDIAWITNLRGLDIAYNPVFLSFLLISQSHATLFVDINKIPPNLRAGLATQGFELAEYESVETHLCELARARVLVDNQKTSVFFARILKDGDNKLIKAPNPSTLLKIHKSRKELRHFKNAMIADGIALCEFFAWLEKAMKQGAKLSELDIDTQISVFRAKHPLYICNSFATIAGFNANSALPHYQATAQEHAQISGNGLLLIDSGAQYQNGTTDITRVVPVGKVFKAQQRDYTRVLKALIALSRAIFPINTALSSLDSIARANLWHYGLDYMHGTGHGVGYCLGVHEMPVSISQFARHNAYNKANAGIVTSIEPGIYRADKWGVRLENLVAISKISTQEKGFGEFLRFETLTLCPFESSLIDFTMLDKSEKSWLKGYHQKVFQALAPHLRGQALSWLKRKVAKFERKI